MKVRSYTIQQLKKGHKARCRDWRFWAVTDHGRKSVIWHGTWTDAQKAILDWVSELEGLNPEAGTFASYAASWRSWREASGDYAPNTISNDARNVKALMRTELADKNLSEITPADCRDALAWLKAHPVSGRGELSGTTMNKLALALGSILKQARDDGLIVRSPMESVKLPKVDTREKDAMTPAELTAFLDAVDELPIDGRTVALYLMATMGLRRGEALALLDSDVSGGYANVHLSVKEADGSVSVPKSPASVRTVPIPRRTMERISLWREVRKAAGFGDAERLCCNTEGGLLLPQNLWKWWAKVRGGLGCEGMGLHQLRHSNLSMMARHMSPFDLQRYAGWSSIEPARVYIHADLDSVTRAVEGAWS